MKHTPSNETVVPGDDLWGAAAHGAAAAASAPRRSRRRRGLGARAALAVVPLAVLASGAMVYQASNAAFTATTGTPSNSWTAGTVVLADNDGNSALFTVSPLKPGVASAATTKCINVTYTGSLPANVKMYVSAHSQTPGTNGGDLGTQLRVSIEEGTSATDSACTGFTSFGTPKWLTTGAAKGETLNAFETGTTSFTLPGVNYESGATPWAAPAGNVTPQVESYRIIYWLPDTNDPDHAPADQATLDTVQGSVASATLTWEARNT